MCYYLYYNTILVWGLFSIWITNATNCLSYTPCLNIHQVCIKFKYVKFQSVIFYSELKEVCGNYVWILKWVNLCCNWIKVQQITVKNWWLYKNILQLVCCRRHKILIHCTTCYSFGTWYLLCFDQSKQKSKIDKVKVNHW